MRGRVGHAPARPRCYDERRSAHYDPKEPPMIRSDMIPTLPTPTTAKVAMALMATRPRKVWRAVPIPTEDQALAVVCKLIDLGLDCDERNVQLAVAVLKSRLTLADIKEAC